MRGSSIRGSARATRAPRQATELPRQAHKFNAQAMDYPSGRRTPSHRSTSGREAYPPPVNGDLHMTYLIRIALLGISVATITPVARGATLDAPQAGFQQAGLGG